MTHITDLELYKENDNYYLAARISFEDENGFYEASIPRIHFPVKSECCLKNISEQSHGIPLHRIVSLDFGLGELYAEPFDKDGTYFTITCIQEKVHKMTLSEIEKILGYKIELIKE